MAYYAALIPVIQLLDDILLRNRYPSLPLAQNTILKSLHEKFSLLEDSLQGYSSKGSEANDRLEGGIRDVAYCVQDVIESEISHQILVSRGKARAAESIFHESSPLAGVYLPVRPLGVKKSILHKLFSDLKVAVCRRRKRRTDYVEYLQTMLPEIGYVVQELMAIKEEEFKPHRDSFEIYFSKRAPFVGSNTVVGLDADLTTIKGMLCGQSTKTLQFIPVVGMGGIGKTTLARTTFDDALIVEHFDRRIWVTVSQDYQLSHVLRSIKTCLDLEGNDSPLEERIYKHLKGRRYLIVMDDVWNTKVWDDVKRLFPDDCNGSRIMLTTRLLDVARYAATSDVHHEMQCLDDEQSWNLLRRKVFVHENCPSELEHIGKNIARQCCGLPLSLVVVAGILSSVKTRDSWESIATNVRAILSSANETLAGILSLSYNHLPHQLKACFLYMGSFPEDHEIDISNLIFLWIAEGFLKSEKESKLSLEEQGEECLNDLVRRNLVTMKKPPYGEFKFCALHDILRDFCRQRALHECFFHDVTYNDRFTSDTPNIKSTVRRITANLNYLRRDARCSIADTLVRSVRIFGKEVLSPSYSDGRRYRLFRVLDFSEVIPFNNLLSEMFHLKYLKLNHEKYPGSVQDLRKWIPMLLNLQTIILTGNRSCGMFSSQIWKMTQLRHCMIFNRFWLTPVCEFYGNIRMQKLEYLQTLMNVADFTISDEVVEMIPNLRNLKIEFDEIEGRHCLHNLVCFQHLEELQIKHRCFYNCSHVSFPRSFALPSNLRDLYIARIKLSGEVLKMIGCLPNLQGLKLENTRIEGKVWVVTEEEFPRLKVLLMKELVDLEEWRAEGSLFPCLEILNITYCRELQEIPTEIGDIPTLRLIEIRHSSLCKPSANQIREEQQEVGNELLQVHIRR